MTEPWKVAILARFRRPIAVCLIMLGDGGIWLVPYVAFFFALIVLAFAGWAWGWTTVLAILAAGFITGFGCLAYIQYDRNLPKREKKESGNGPSA